MQTDRPGKTPFPAAYQFADTFQPSEQPVWKAIYFQTYQVGVLAAGAEWIITSIKIHSARGQWIFCVTTYPVLSSLNVCRFFSCAYIQSVTLGQLWEAQESNPEVWFLLPCCLVVVGLEVWWGSSRHRGCAALPGSGLRENLHWSWAWSAELLTPETLYMNMQMGCLLLLLCNNCTKMLLS